MATEAVSILMMKKSIMITVMTTLMTCVPKIANVIVASIANVDVVANEIFGKTSC
jgi:hypothetical protein